MLNPTSTQGPAPPAYRLLRYLFLGLLSLVGFAVLIGLGLFLWASFEKEDAFYIKGASLAEPHYLESLERRQQETWNTPEYKEVEQKLWAAAGHRIAAGGGTVIGYRWFSAGDVWAADDELYKKLTIELPPGQKLDAALELDLASSPGVQVLYAHGGSAWPGANWAGRVKSGTLKIEPKGLLLDVSLTGRFTPVRAAHCVLGDCKEEDVAIEFLAPPEDLDDLTFWLGAKGATHPYQETYRALIHWE